MFRFQEGFFQDSVVEDAKKTFEVLKRELPEDIKSVEICRNCVDREGNCDLAVIMELKEAASLDRYLDHPVHRELVGRWAPEIRMRASFDSCEDARP